MGLVKKWWKALDGKKTFIGVALYFVIGGLLYLGLITEKEAMEIGFFITAWTGYSLRDGIRKLEK